MAEATLMIASKPPGIMPVMRKFGSKLTVGCGQVDDKHQLLVVNPNTLERCAEHIVGEIWVRGPSVALGYWQRPELNAQTFQAYSGDDGPFLRTGDLGFKYNDELFVTGRLKDLIIIRGRNHYPQDIEQTVARSHVALSKSAGAAFSVDNDRAEKLVVVHEVKRSFVRKLNANEIFLSIRQHISDYHELEVHSIVLLKPANIPKTSSGKIQRSKCRQKFIEKTLDPISEWSSVVNNSGAVGIKADVSQVNIDPMPKSVKHIQQWLQDKCAERLQIPVSTIAVDVPFSQFGMDSITAVEVSIELEEWLDISVPSTLIYDYPSIVQVAEYLGTQLPYDTDLGVRY
jgi:acyl carrier protein